MKRKEIEKRGEIAESDQSDVQLGMIKEEGHSNSSKTLTCK